MADRRAGFTGDDGVEDRFGSGGRDLVESKSFQTRSWASRLCSCQTDPQIHGSENVGVSDVPCYLGF